jgi:hypothetical protein
VAPGLCAQLICVAEPDHIIASLQRIAADLPRLAEPASAALTTPVVIRSLWAHYVVYVSGMPGVLRAILAGDWLDEAVVRAAHEELTRQGRPWVPPAPTAVAGRVRGTRCTPRMRKWPVLRRRHPRRSR